MNAWKNHRFSFLLAASSLLLLLLFQAFWLRNVYESEKEGLRERADLVLENAMGSIRDSMIHILLTDFPNGELEEAKTIIKFQDDHQENKVTAQREIKIVKQDTFINLNIDLSEDSILKGGSRKIKANSVAVWMSSDSNAMALPERVEGMVSNLSSIETQLPELTSKADLPSPYQIVVLEESTNPTSGLFSNEKSYLWTQEHFALYFPTYKSYLFKKILPQILFSIFLFGAILFSFFMVWQSLEKQRRLTELKNDFISNVTHELKTPITTVGVALEALSNFNALQNPERTEEYINISKHELQRLSLLVDKVLKMSLFEKKEPELKLELFDMQNLVKGVLRSMKLQFEKFSANVNIDFEGSDFSIKGDKIHLTNVVYNLIDNALKYSKEKPVISLLLKQENGELKLIVRDKGIGISPNLKDKIFEKFFRVPQGDLHDVKGYGLGLSYVAGVIKKHHGDIQVDSELNEGTAFTISLPTNYE